MKRNIFWLFVGFCLLTSSTDSLLFDCPLPSLPIVPSILSLTEPVVDQVITQVIAAFGTTADEIQKSVDMTLDGVVNKVLDTIYNTPGANDSLLNLLTKTNQAKPPPMNFPCTDSSQFKSATKPTNINQVRIGDVQCMGLMGDSVAAGLGINGDSILSATLGQYRCYEAKTGGAGNANSGDTSVANIFRDLFQNTDLKGQSTYVGSCLQTSTCAGLNVANILAFHPDYIVQAGLLVKKILFGSYCKYNDIKIIHVFYGVNDLCLLCQTLHYDNIAMMKLHLRIAIAILKLFLPNTLIYLHVPYDLTPLYSLSTNPGCAIVQKALCPCVSDSTLLHVDGSSVRKNQLIIADELVNICKDFNKCDTSNNFQCSVIRHLTNTKPPTDSNGNLQPEILGANCLHPSRAAHDIYGMYAFNEMMTAPDDRPLSADYTVNTNNPITLKCPTATNPYLRTYNN